MQVLPLVKYAYSKALVKNEIFQKTTQTILRSKNDITPQKTDR